MNKALSAFLGTVLWCGFGATLSGCGPLTPPQRQVLVQAIPKDVLVSRQHPAFPFSALDIGEDNLVIGVDGASVHTVALSGHLDVIDSEEFCAHSNCDIEPQRTEQCSSNCLCPQKLTGGWWEHDHIVVDESLIAELEIEDHVISISVCETPTSQRWVNGE